MAQGQLHPCVSQLCSQPRLQSSSSVPGSDGAHVGVGPYISSGCRPDRWAHWHDSPTERQCLGMTPFPPPLTTQSTETTLSSHPTSSKRGEVKDRSLGGGLEPRHLASQKGRQPREANGAETSPAAPVPLSSPAGSLAPSAVPTLAISTCHCCSGVRQG